MPAFLQDYLDDYFQKQREQQGRLGNGYRNTERVYDDVRKEWITGADFVNRIKRYLMIYSVSVIINVPPFDGISALLL